MFGFGYKMLVTKSCLLTLYKPFLKHLHFSVIVLCKVPENFLFAKCVAVEKEFHFAIAESVFFYYVTDLPKRLLLTWKTLSRSCKSVIHVHSINLGCFE